MKFVRNGKVFFSAFSKGKRAIVRTLSGGGGDGGDVCHVTSPPV